MSLTELSAVTGSVKLLKRYELLQIVQELGLQVSPIMNKHIGKYDSNLIGINDYLCYIMPLDSNLSIVSEVVLNDTDFIIGSHRIYGKTDYYIIPSDIVKQNGLSYPFNFEEFKDAWDFLLQ